MTLLTDHSLRLRPARHVGLYTPTWVTRGPSLGVAPEGKQRECIIIEIPQIGGYERVRVREQFAISPPRASRSALSVLPSCTQPNLHTYLSEEVVDTTANPKT